MIAAMSDPINSVSSVDTIVNDSLSDKSDNVICEEPVLAGKANIDDDVTKWSIVHFDTDEEENIEGFNDFIPSSWITTAGTMSRYPMDEHKATIHKLVKKCAKANLEWSCFSIKKIQEGIGNYDRGMKMLVKISKNPNVTLHSDVEEKGKGRGLKKPIKYFDDSDKENNLEKRRNAQTMLPPLPKLTNVSKSAREMNVPHEIPKNKDHMECKGVKLPKESSVFTEMRNSKSATIISERICSHQKFFVNAKGCKIPSKINHNCAYTLEGEVTLESLADAVCYLNAEMLSCKLTLRKTDKNVESFLETEMMAKKPTTGTPSTTVHILDEFPITNLNDLKKLEHRLKKDETFYSKVVDALHLGIMGEFIQKKINSMLRMVLDDKLASLFNWKGQRGTKLKLSKRRITKIMIEAVTKECPTINETMFGRKAGPWLAQATFRIKKHISNNDEAYPDDNSSENCESDDDDEDQKSDEEKNLP